MKIIKLIPNILTLGRLVLTVIFLIMILYTKQVAEENMVFFLDIAFVVFVVSGLTDIFDGMAARKLNVTSKFGRMLDPLVDKILVCGTFICFAIVGLPELFNFNPGTLAAIQWTMAAILIAREAYVTALRHIAEARGVNFGATIIGKLKMFTHSFAIGTVIIKTAHVRDAAWGNWFTIAVYIITAAVTIMSGLVYQIRWNKYYAKSSLD